MLSRSMIKLFNSVLITQVERETGADIFWNKYKPDVYFKDICNYNNKDFIKSEEMKKICIFHQLIYAHCHC